jgi:hypothetical protein
MSSLTHYSCHSVPLFLQKFLFNGHRSCMRAVDAYTECAGDRTTIYFYSILCAMSPHITERKHGPGYALLEKSTDKKKKSQVEL